MWFVGVGVGVSHLVLKEKKIVNINGGHNAVLLTIDVDVWTLLPKVSSKRHPRHTSQ